jgi:hypothetical protein
MLLLAMELQAKRHGVEFECRRCKHLFLHKVAPADVAVEAVADSDD